jgi:hypothetical protein
VRGQLQEPAHEEGANREQRIERRQRQSSGATVTTRLAGVVRAELACDHVDFCTTRDETPTETGVV